MKRERTDTVSTEEAPAKVRKIRSQRMRINWDPPDINGSFSNVQATAVTRHLLNSRFFWQFEEFLIAWDKMTAPPARAVFWRGFNPVIVMPQTGDVFNPDITYRWRQKMALVSSSGFDDRGRIYTGSVRYERLLQSLRNDLFIDEQTAVVAVSNDISISIYGCDLRKMRPIRADYLLTPALGLVAVRDIREYFHVNREILKRIPSEITGKTAPLSALDLHGGVTGELPADVLHS